MSAVHLLKIVLLFCLNLSAENLRRGLYADFVNTSKHSGRVATLAAQHNNF